MEIPCLPLSKYIQACDVLMVMNDEVDVISQPMTKIVDGQQITLFGGLPRYGSAIHTFTSRYEYIRDIQVSHMTNVRHITLDANGYILWTAVPPPRSGNKDPRILDNSGNNTSIDPPFTGMKVYPIRSLLFTTTRLTACPEDDTKPCSFKLSWNWIHPITKLNIEELVARSVTYEDFSSGGNNEKGYKVIYSGGSLGIPTNLDEVVKSSTTNIDRDSIYNQYSKQQDDNGDNAFIVDEKLRNWKYTLNKVINNTLYPTEDYFTVKKR